MAVEEEKCETYGMHHDGDRPCYHCMWDELRERRTMATALHVLNPPRNTFRKEAFADLLVVCEAWSKRIECKSRDTQARFDYEANLFLDKWFTK